MVIQNLVAAACVTLAQAAPAPEAARSPADPTEWLSSLDAARTAARGSGRPIALYFWLEDSSFCQRMYTETLTSERGADELAHFVCVSVPVDGDNAAQLVQRFGVSKLPTLVFTNADGETEDAIRGFIDVEGFVTELQRIRRGEMTVSAWRSQAAASPEDLDVRLQLALQLAHVGQTAESQRLQQSILEADPRGETVAGAQLALYDVFSVITGSAPDASDPSTYELRPLYEHMPRVTPAPVLYEGWKWIADVEMQRGDRPRERVALGHAFDNAEPGEQSVSLGFSLLQRFFAMQDELSDSERALATRVGAHIEAETEKVPDFDKHDQLHHVRALALAINRERELALAEIEKAQALAPDQVLHQRLRDLLRAGR